MHNFQYREVADNKVSFALILSAANKLSTADKVNSIINYPKGKGFIFSNVILITGTYHLGLFELLDIIMLYTAALVLSIK